MANLAADAILTRIREVMDDGAGSLRAISSSRFSEQFYPEMNDDASGIAAMVTPRYDVRMRGVRPNKATPCIMGSKYIYDVDLEITVVRDMNKLHELDDSVRDDVLALAMEDACVIQQAMCTAGNLTQTSGGTATGLASGSLRYVESSADVVLSDGDRAALVRSKHVFTAIAVVTLATS